ncbi:hypothetical protein V0R50_24145 [Pseudomonas sp. 148P]|uniref:Secreted protein n=1 Tax=Pseudomonas ulcerans TaxID=3115852 RepID=A0ABU7HXP3_9PSED|nr:MULTISPECIES: hypothetical protein [unclassified Pseudomonas]MEE1924818.1 hypothetical protein [Pseudomonas sp. 147P]MEE1936330.1 hypothetical protein [Pseudomonas sp. 148P]
MSLRLLLGSLALSASLGAHALDTNNLTETELLALATSLAQNAGSSQWQQLWQRTRSAGHLAPGKVPYFTIPQQQIAELALVTLESADGASAGKGTRALYRRDFQPLVVGNDNGTPLSAVCLSVDWRTVPDNLSGSAVPWMGQISLLLSQPCP